MKPRWSRAARPTSPIWMRALARIGLTAVVSIETPSPAAGEEDPDSGRRRRGPPVSPSQLAKHIGAHCRRHLQRPHMTIARLGEDEVIGLQRAGFCGIGLGLRSVFETWAATWPSAHSPCSGQEPRGVHRLGRRPRGAPARRPTASAQGRARRPARTCCASSSWSKAGASGAQIRTYPLEDTASALATSAARHLRGKLVLSIR